MIRRQRRRNATIEMTSLMDLVFMLLIVFVVSVPVLDYTTDVTPPKLTTNTQPPQSDPQAVFLKLDADGRYFVDDVPVAAYELDDALKNLAASGKVKVIVRGDAKRPYEDIIAAVRAGKHAGMEVSLMTQQE